MTPEELREWSAVKVMGFEVYAEDAPWPAYTWTRANKVDGMMFVKDWTPDTDLNQAFMVARKMIERGFELKLGYGNTIQGILCWVRFETESFKSYFHDKSPALAILLAAKATEEPT